MPIPVTRWLPLAVIILVALGLRTWDLGRRPMHADEANQAVKAGQLLETGRYTFNPADHHGPTLYYAVLPVAWLRGEHTLAQLSETTVRLVPALAGTAAVFLLFVLARPGGLWPALLAAAFLAVSPPAVYYSRYFIQETLLAAFTLGMLACAHRWWQSGRLRWAIGAGLCTGFMQATKASAPLFLVAAAAGVLAARTGRPAAVRPWRDAALAAIGAVVTAALFYSSFGTNLHGLADAWTTYPSIWTRLGSETGHEKPWWYYLSLFGWQQHGGLVFQQAIFSLLVLSGLGVAMFTRGHPALRGAAAYAAVLLVLLSAVSYKTPWHAIHLVPAFAVLAAGALSALPLRPNYVALGTALAFTGLLAQLTQVRLTSFLRPADERNPYAYVHSSPDVQKVRALVEDARRAGRTGPVRIISEEVWPLPWYLRGLPGVGYWTSVPAECDGALVIASASLADVVQARLHGDYDIDYLGLRPGFTLVVFKPRS
jgi:uncharacterized protein (TIGR03663 family)